MDHIVSLGAFIVLLALWAAFGYALVAGQGSLDATWESLRSLPLVLQALVAFLLLPVVAGLWIWESGWPLVARLVVVGGLAAWSLFLFAPRWLWGGRS